MRLGCSTFWVPVWAAGMIWTGTQRIQEARAFRNPTKISYQEFVQDPPTNGWFHITGCRMYLPEAVYTVLTEDGKDLTTPEGRPRITELFLPVHADDEMDDEPAESETGEAEESETPIVLVLKTTDPAQIEAMAKYVTLGDNENEIREFIENHGADMFRSGDLTGMVAAGIDLEQSTRDEIARLDETLAPNFVILEEGRKPSLMTALLWLGGGSVLGLVSLVIGVLAFVRRRL